MIISFILCGFVFIYVVVIVWLSIIFAIQFASVFFVKM